MAKRLGSDRLTASIAEMLEVVGAADKARLTRENGEAVVAAAVTGLGALRATQMPPPGEWSIWAIVAGRGFGKTRTGAEWILERAAVPGTRLALVVPSLESARAVMVEGESGILARAPEAAGVMFQASLHRLKWNNGSEARLFSGGEPDMLRGGQFDFGWGDEFAHWPRAEAALTNLRMATRLGRRPQLLLTTTPRPLPWLKALLAEPDVAVTRGGMAENAANLPTAFLTALEARYGGTAVGRQEIEGELIETLEGALWSRGLIETQRRRAVPPLARIVVGVDPPAGGVAAVCGIVVVGLDGHGQAWVLEDASVEGARPEVWARAVVSAVARYEADQVIAEINNGGDMVTSLLRSVDAGLPLTTVRAARGKVARAEPVASLYGEGRVFHAGGFAALEDQLCGLMLNGSYLGPGGSPDRADALVWAVTSLLLMPRAGQPAVRGL